MSLHPYPLYDGLRIGRDGLHRTTVPHTAPTPPHAAPIPHHTAPLEPPASASVMETSSPSVQPLSQPLVYEGLSEREAALCRKEEELKEAMAALEKGREELAAGVLEVKVREEAVRRRARDMDVHDSAVPVVCLAAAAVWVEVQAARGALLTTRCSVEERTELRTCKYTEHVALMVERRLAAEQRHREVSERSRQVIKELHRVEGLGPAAWC